jgi:hypothetical protein
MNDSVRQVLNTICGSARFSPELILSLAAVPDLEKALLAAAEQEVADQRWGCLCRLVWVMQRRPSKEFVPFLCGLLDERQDDGYMEAVIDALNIIPDQRAIHSLTGALSYRMPGDDLAFHFNKKVITALDHIGTDESRAAISLAERSPEEPIRSFAREILAQS